MEFLDASQQPLFLYDIFENIIFLEWESIYYTRVDEAIELKKPTSVLSECRTISSTPQVKVSNSICERRKF